jgi:hypothetical protein
MIKRGNCVSYIDVHTDSMLQCDDFPDLRSPDLCQHLLLSPLLSNLPLSLRHNLLPRAAMHPQQHLVNTLHFLASNFF